MSVQYIFSIAGVFAVAHIQITFIIIANHHITKWGPLGPR